MTKLDKNRTKCWFLKFGRYFQVLVEFVLLCLTKHTIHVSLFSGFCNNPKDLKESFNDIVKHLGKNLQDRKDLRMYILASLRQLILKNVDNEENKAVLGKWAIKFLDTMCNLYLKKPSGAEESGQRSSIMETIKLFLTLVDPSQLGK